MTNSNKNFLAKILVAIVTLVSIVQFGILPALAATYTATGISDTMSRDMLSVTGVTHSVTMSLPAGGSPYTGTVILTYTNFTAFAGAGGSGTCVGGTVAGTSSSVNVETVTLTGCTTGTLTITGFTGTNPSGAGSNTVAITGTANVVGSFAVTTVANDQISITASIDPSITFNVGMQSSGTACAGTFSGNGGTVALGTLTTGAVATSDNGSIGNICSRLTTNAGSGAVVTVTSANGALKSGTDQINSATATLVAGTSGYGICAGSSSDSGKDTTTPVSATPAATSPFNSTCTAAAHSVGALTTSPQSIWSVPNASQNAYFKIYVKAAISGTVPAHTNYADTLTFVATGTF
jgi:hypothetical protein